MTTFNSLSFFFQNWHILVDVLNILHFKFSHLAVNILAITQGEIKQDMLLWEVHVKIVYSSFADRWT